uniref:Arabidopsis retrotransposon Orf1 C-terminal domain-containing protein n=1 Tax=Brassica oleracea var. oleracea TaxID=109376 RepID=A0A0D3C8P2_BRAOL
MKCTKTSAKKHTQEEISSQREKKMSKKWSKSDTTHYNNMKNVVVPATHLACPETMTILGIKSDIEGLFQNMGLGQLCNLNEPTYPELVRQFIASAYIAPPDDSHQEGFLAFVVQKVYFETSELLDFWETIGTGVYRSSQAKESLIRNPVPRYATRLIGSLLYGTTTAASVTQWELCLLYQGVRHLLPAFGNSTFPPATAFNMGAVLAANLVGYKGKLTKSKSSACGFGAVIIRILRHVGVDYENHRAAVEFLPPATTLIDKPPFFTPKYQTKGKAVDDEEGEDEAAQTIPDDDSQPHQLLPSDSSQYKLQELPPNATSRQQQHWRDQSIKTNNDMLHKIWAAISRIRPCRCQKDDVVHRDNSPSSSGSGSSGARRARKRSKRPEDAGTSGAGDKELELSPASIVI